jgi:tape measure domain-containing protein
MTTVVSAEIDTSPAEKSAKTFSNVINTMRTDAKNFTADVDGMKKKVKEFSDAAGAVKAKPFSNIVDLTKVDAKAFSGSVDGMKQSVAEFEAAAKAAQTKPFANILSGTAGNAKAFTASTDTMKKSVTDFAATANAAKFGKPIADEAQVVVKSATTIGSSLSTVVAKIKAFAAALGSTLWGGVKATLAGVANAILAIGGAALSGFGLFRSEVERSGGGGPGGIGGFLAALLSTKALIVGMASAGLGIVTKLAHDVVAVADAFENTKRKLDSLGLSLEAARGIADRNGATLKMVAAEYEALSTSLTGMGATSEQTRLILEAATLSLKNSGNNADETRAKIIAMSMAFDNGRLSIKEWHNLVSDFPEAAKSMQDALGLTDDKMAKFARDGGLHANDFANAIIRTADIVKQKAAGQADSFEVAEGRMSRSWTNLISTIADTTGLTNAFTKAETAIASGMDRLATYFKANNPFAFGAGLVPWVTDKTPEEMGQDPIKPLSPLKLLDLGPKPPANLKDNGFSMPTPEDRQASTMKEKIAALAAQNNLLRISFQQDTALTQEARVQLEVEKATTAEMRAKHPQLVQQLTDQYRINEALKEQQKQGQQADELGQGIAKAFSDEFVQVAKGTESFKDGIRKAVAASVELIGQMLVLRPLIEDIGRKFKQLATDGSGSGGGSGGLLGALFGGLFGGDVGLGSWDATVTPAAKGHVFGPGGVEAFASGGVVSKPTLFKHAGGLGLMGEAGPEAIMPMTNGGIRTTSGHVLPIGRSSSGHLSVKAFARGGVIGGSSPFDVSYSPSAVRAPDMGSSDAGVTQVENHFHFNIDGDATDATLKKMQDIADYKIAQATPQIVKQSKAAVQRENRENGKFLRR